jgi:hypothetical protein
MTRHKYLSTSCLHAMEPGREALHAYCQADTGLCGSKTPGRCKFCDACCMCRCHQGGPAPTFGVGLSQGSAP